jgi:hypothetical protein
MNELYGKSKAKKKTGLENKNIYVKCSMAITVFPETFFLV